MAWYTGPARAHCVFSLNEGMARSTSDVAQQDSSRAVRSPGAAVRISSVQFSRSVVSDSVIPWTAARQAALSITNSRSPPRLAPVQILALRCTCSLGLDIPVTSRASVSSSGKWGCLAHDVGPTISSHFPSASSAPVRRRHATYLRKNPILASLCALAAALIRNDLTVAFCFARFYALKTQSRPAPPTGPLSDDCSL
ncbi:hypothetical protein MG293_000026 [Ovis ammon polii]|uniref:Uncharacterized protein n=1 Tax=Ovis ammon polii TaxID=230172 RepID=A0AAD4UM27_OVIAM|nr:hypothetical protein MG293_000026 [Ovis ammon polii]